MIVLVLEGGSLPEAGLVEWWVAEVSVKKTLEDQSGCCSQWMQAHVSEVWVVGCLVLACLCPTYE